MKIREMDLADLPALYDIYIDKEVVNNNRYSADIKRGEFDAMFNDSQRHFVAVAKDGGLLGHLALNLSTKPRLKHSASFGVAVAKASRGKGVGRFLLEHLVSYCDKELDLARLELEVHANNAAALSLYKSFCFEVEGTKRKAVLVEGELIDIIIMSRVGN
ncbi:GNAT family N-acetyltransferase [Vibrio chagasii]|uniref:GNAT family N-acetyltransferase n=1 Tax=Vibrio chagasii TaxID=170679 RepID=UPI001EFC8CB5|nr:GNAT family N-acetyltransferase [Vibrio chagasii]MCG9566870.1 GNAT family N-acetyltransferase [Vibrio chagasii]CAH6828810.1 GNAT family N-acetyltransferase [Vibrio chagasii]CAH6882522.1 GNAT family N-acetyltransferase [Vibrio chagasii]CAH6896482.1 GNAT family N-acetyltransferase [Vibrio chagasii]CAH6908625.1 GNAT family N-acetyltransferase [Vibrio chagasii]